MSAGSAASHRGRSSPAFVMPGSFPEVACAGAACGGRRRSGESGFAMLFVFLMAAAAALLFYRELPRIAFERQREKEQLLIERGEQYRRAIQLFVRKFNRYPAELSQLENTNNIRFLRRRYKDPMTGKSEWRLIHAGPGGVLVDSLVNKPDSPEKDENKRQEAAGTLEGGGQAAQPVVRRRPSEMLGMYPAAGATVETAGGMVGGVDVPPAGDPGGQVGAQPPYYPVQPGQPPPPVPQPWQPQPGQGGVYYVIQPGSHPAQGGQSQTYAPGGAGQAIMTPGAQPGQPPYVLIPVPTGQPGSFTTPQPGQAVGVSIPGPGGQWPSAALVGAPGGAGMQPGQGQPAPYPTQNVPGLPAPYGQPGVPSIGAITITPGTAQPQAGAPTYSTQPGVGGAPAPGYAAFPQPGYQPAPSEPAQNPALQIIRDILTKPRSGGLAAIQQQQAAAGSQQVLGGGIAGVSSTLEAEGIMVYNDRTKYNEWEFVYDIRKDPVKMAQMGMTPVAPGTQADSGKTMVPETASQNPPSLDTPPSGRRRR